MTRRVVGKVGPAALVLLSVACGKSPEEKQAEAIAKGTEQVAKGLEDMVKGIAGDASGKPVEPVSVGALIPLLPDLPGWVRDEPEGDRTTGFGAHASAHATYRKGDASIDAKITDAALNQAFFAPFIVLMAGNYSHESANGWEKSTKFGDNPGLEKWDKPSRSGSINIIVAKRFLVELDGQDLDDVTPVRTLAQRTDLKKLAALK